MAAQVYDPAPSDTTQTSGYFLCFSVTQFTHLTANIIGRMKESGACIHACVCVICDMCGVSMCLCMWCVCACVWCVHVFCMLCSVCIEYVCVVCGISMCCI